MFMRNFALISIAGAFGLAVGGCAHDNRVARRDSVTEQRSDSNVLAALARYRQLIIDIEAEQLANMFVENGELSHDSEEPFLGRNAIRAFLKNFAGYKVIEYDLVATSTEVVAGLAKQRGTYAQRVLSPDGKTIRAKGQFAATWLQQSDGSWLLGRMHTTSS